MGKWGAVLALLCLVCACGSSSNSSSANYGAGIGAVPSPSPSASPSSAHRSPSPTRGSTPSARPVPTPKPAPVAKKGGGGVQFTSGYYTALTGTYTYSYATSGSGATPSSGSATLGVSDGSVTSASRQQYFNLNTPDGSAVDDVRWSAGSRNIQSTTFSQGGSAFECDWQPAELDLQLPLSNGASWQSSSSCDISSGGLTGTIQEQAQNKVVGTASITVGGVAVSTFQISVTGTFTIAVGPQTQTVNVTANEWFAPRYGLYVKEVQETKSNSATGGATDTTETLQLQGLNPS